MSLDKDILTIRKDGKYFAHVTLEQDIYVTWGNIGENKYNNLIDVLKSLDGFDIHLDDIFWD